MVWLRNRSRVEISSTISETTRWVLRAPATTTAAAAAALPRQSSCSFISLQSPLLPSACATTCPHGLLHEAAATCPATTCFFRSPCCRHVPLTKDAALEEPSKTMLCRPTPPPPSAAAAVCPVTTCLFRSPCCRPVLLTQDGAQQAPSKMMLCRHTHCPLAFDAAQWCSAVSRSRAPLHAALAQVGSR
jgi:hypothetical protein